MVSNREAVFRFKIDIQNFEAQIKKMDQLLTRLEQHTTKTKQSMDTFRQSTDGAGKSSVTAAVNFQTATQGLLNLSTAAVQTYTSISNLDRANNRAKQSIIAVARAEDLLNNKIERRNQMEEKGIVSGMKYANIQREIATAEADLTVKKEKMAIEQAAVNDVYMLFATNVANVVISSTQTMVVLIGQERAARIGSTIATKLHTLATWDNIRAARWQAKETAALSALFAGTSKAQIGLTLSTRLATAATNAFKIALGPIGLIMIGISGAMMAYEANLGGIKDTINGLLGIHDDFADSLEEARNATDNFTDSQRELTKMGDQRVPESFRKMKEALKEYRIELIKASAEQSTFISRGGSIGYQLGQRQPPLGNGGAYSPLDFGGNQVAYGQEYIASAIPTAQIANTTAAITSFSTIRQLPQGYQGPGMAVSNQYLLPGGIQIDLKKLEGKVDDMLLDKFITYQDYLDQVNAGNVKLAIEYAKIVNEQILRAGGVPKTLYTIPGMENLIGVRSELFNRGEITDLSFLEERQRMSFISKALMAGQGHLVRMISPSIRENIILNGRSLAGRTARDVNRARAYSLGSRIDTFAYAGIEDPKDVTANQYIRLLAAQKGISGSITLTGKERKIFKGLEDGTITGNRAMVAVMTGVDVGNFANSVSEEEALRIGMLERDIGLSLQIRSPENLFKAGLLEKTGFSYSGLAFVGTGKARPNQSPFPGNMTPGAGQYLEVNIDGRRYSVPRGETAYNDLNQAALQSNLSTANLLRANAQITGYKSTGYNNFATMATGSFNAFAGVSATAAYQVGRTASGKSKVVVPAWVKAQIAREDAWRNSIEGQNAFAAQALLTGGSFAYSRRVARAGGGLSQDMALTIRAAGLLGVSVPYTAFETTASQIFTGASAGLSEIVKANNVRQEFLFAAMNAISQTSAAAVKRIIPYGFSAIRNQLAAQEYNQMARTMTQQGLQNYVGRVAQGNFGIYDATVLNAMTGATVSEYTSEISDFNSKIAPLLNIAHSDFKTTLVDPKRGINEIDDRIRWTQRLEQISTGATVF